jgi:hypothetical protein
MEDVFGMTMGICFHDVYQRLCSPAVAASLRTEKQIPYLVENIPLEHTCDLKYTVINAP